MSLPAAPEHLTPQRDSTSIVHLSDLGDDPPVRDSDHLQHRASDHVRAAERRPKLKAHRTTIMFRECEALEFNNCHFTYTGGDHDRSDVHNLHPELLLPFPISTPTPPSIPNRYRIATTAVLVIAACLLILMGYLIA
ncbi:hypothetical protein BKA70DRAFT_1231097 [Coprinopsis sp. MPI-PUGE-AT-0042]|nr:hypothetical protein BKA70DRAFT_1231097 [Coprinopsis sp. MPI-PUGE-AT-0042]